MDAFGRGRELVRKDDRYVQILEMAGYLRGGRAAGRRSADAF